MTAPSSRATAPSGRVPLWRVLEDAVAGTTAHDEWTVAQRVPTRVPEPRAELVSHDGRVGDLVLVVLTVAVLLVAAAAVLLLPAVR